MDKVIIGIDFGTSGIGFAYAFLNENTTQVMSQWEVKIIIKKSQLKLY